MMVWSFDEHGRQALPVRMARKTKRAKTAITLPENIMLPIPTPKIVEIRVILSSDYRAGDFSRSWTTWSKSLGSERIKLYVWGIGNQVLVIIVARSKHTRPQDIIAARRVRLPHEPRGKDD